MRRPAAEPCAAGQQFGNGAGEGVGAVNPAAVICVYKFLTECPGEAWEFHRTSLKSFQTVPYMWGAFKNKVADKPVFKIGYMCSGRYFGGKILK